MEAPEKIWMTDDWVWQFDDKDFMGEDSIEYIRTDAFIEKACLWLKDNIDRYLYNTGGIDEYIPKCGGKMIEDFKSYMEK